MYTFVLKTFKKITSIVWVVKFPELEPSKACSEPNLGVCVPIRPEHVFNFSAISLVPECQPWADPELKAVPLH